MDSKGMKASGMDNFYCFKNFQKMHIMLKTAQFSKGDIFYR